LPTANIMQLSRCNKHGDCDSNESPTRCNNSSSLLSLRLFTAQHVLGVLTPIIRSSTVVAASGFYLQSIVIAVLLVVVRPYKRPGDSNKSPTRCNNFSSLLSLRLFTAQHVLGVLTPIIRSSTVVAASAFFLQSVVTAVLLVVVGPYKQPNHITTFWR
jgi:hypothetical protein